MTNVSSWFLSRKSKSGQDIARSIRDILHRVQSLSSYNQSSEQKKAFEDLCRALLEAKALIQKEDAREQHYKNVHQLYEKVLKYDILNKIAESLDLLSFECRKHATFLFAAMLNHVDDAILLNECIQYIQNKNITEKLLLKYQTHAIALNAGAMLRECAKHQEIAKKILWSQNFDLFFTLIDDEIFDAASDAFQTFRELLLGFPSLVAVFLNEHNENFFNKYIQLLGSENYVTRRQSLKLLSELLLEKANFRVMTTFVSSTHNLKVIMNLLRDPSRNIQYEAFHIFKIFVANPKKKPAIQKILLKNKDKLLLFLQEFQLDRQDDERFHDERMFLIQEISKLQGEYQPSPKIEPGINELRPPKQNCYYAT